MVRIEIICLISQSSTPQCRCHFLKATEMKQKFRSNKHHTEFSEYRDGPQDKRKKQERDRDRGRRDKYRSRSA